MAGAPLSVTHSAAMIRSRARDLSTAEAGCAVNVQVFGIGPATRPSCAEDGPKLARR